MFNKKGVFIFAAICLLIIFTIVFSLIFTGTSKENFNLLSKNNFYQKYTWGKVDFENKKDYKVFKISNPNEYSGIAFEYIKRLNLTKTKNKGSIVLELKLLKPTKHFYLGLSDLVVNREDNSSSKTVSKINLVKYLNGNKLGWQKVVVPLKDFGDKGEFWLPTGITKKTIDWSKIVSYRFQIQDSEAHFFLKKMFIDRGDLVDIDEYKFFLPDTSKYKQIKVNQTGYNSKNKKIAIYTGDATEFSLMDRSSGKIIFKAKPKLKTKKDLASGDKVYWLDFSKVKKPGKYHIIIGNTKSIPFKIHGSVDFVRNLIKTSLDTYYHQRCINTKCHATHALTDEGNFIDTTGGWHDAGDYSKHIVYGSIAIAQLLDTYKILKHDQAISKQLLEEIQIELDWFLKMQVEDGGVYHRAMTKIFATSYYGKWVTAEDDLQDIYVYDKSTLSTATFAAVMAKASRELPDTFTFNKNLYLKAALNAWSFLLNNKEPILDNFTEDVEDLNKRLWAALELYLTTGSSEYFNYFINNWDPEDSMPQASWEKPLPIGLYSFMEIYPTTTTTTYLKDIVLKAADDLILESRSNGYPNVLKGWEYYWGSNVVILNKNRIFATAYKLTNNKNYLDVIKNQIGYIYGLNPMGISYVTGIGSYSVASPWHPNNGKNFPLLPGLLVGGANQYPKGVDRLLKVLIDKKTPPAKCYISESYLGLGCYGANEPQVNLTSALILSLAYYYIE